MTDAEIIARFMERHPHVGTINVKYTNGDIDRMEAHAKNYHFYAELPAIDEEWENYTTLFSMIIAQVYKNDLYFDAIKVDGWDQRILVDCRNVSERDADGNKIISKFADCFPDAKIAGSTFEELRKELDKLNEEAWTKMRNKGATEKDIYDGPNYYASAYWTNTDILTDL